MYTAIEIATTWRVEIDCKNEGSLPICWTLKQYNVLLVSLQLILHFWQYGFWWKDLYENLIECRAENFDSNRPEGDFHENIFGPIKKLKCKMLYDVQKQLEAWNLGF